MTDKKKEPVALAVMTGTGEPFTSNEGKEYLVKAIKLNQIDEFKKDFNLLGVGPQLFNVLDTKRLDLLKKWIPVICFDAETKEAKTYDKLAEEGFDLADLRNLLRKAADISGF